MRNLWIIIISVCVVAVCVCGCRRHIDARLLEIDRLCDSVPEEAMRRLDSIDQTKLSERDLNRWRLLWIKSRDKAYVAHTSDILILDLVDYYDRHRSEGLYPEALYYGGRVYSDLGDLPTALEYFQKSLDEIPEDDAHLRFKSTVLNQTGRLLHTLRLDSAAIKYLEKSLEVRPEDNSNYSGTAFTHSLIASSLRRQNNFKNARYHTDEAIRISSNLYDSDRLTIQTELAYTLYREKKIDSALIVIRPLPETVDSITKSFCLAVAANIYKAAGIIDTAYLYARQLTKLKTSDNKKTGYQIIFSDEMQEYVPKDTLLKLMPEYKCVVEDYLNTHEAEQALIQNTRYNYSTHLKQREASEQNLRSLKETMRLIATILLITLLAIISVMLWGKYKKTRKGSQIMEGLILTDRLKEEPAYFSPQEKDENENGFLNSGAFLEKQNILEEIRNARELNPAESVDLTLKASHLYKDLKEKAENKNVMGKDVAWRMIEDIVESVSPGFDHRLTILTEGRISSAERNVAYLLKFGFTQTQIASLLSKDASTISAQRTSLARKIGYDKSAIGAIIVRL